MGRIMMELQFVDGLCVKKAERSKAWNDYFLGIKSLQATWMYRGVYGAVIKLI